MTTQLTLADIVRAAVDEFAGAGGVTDRDIEVFLEKLGVADRIVEIAISAMEAAMAELVLDIKRRLLAGQTVGEAYEEAEK